MNFKRVLPNVFFAVAFALFSVSALGLSSALATDVDANDPCSYSITGHCVGKCVGECSCTLSDDAVSCVCE